MNFFKRILTSLAIFASFAMLFNACSKEPLVEPEYSAGDIIKGKYIVVYNDYAKTKSSVDLSYRDGIELVTKATKQLFVEKAIPEENIDHVYGFALNGFAATLNDEQLESLLLDDRIKYIEPVMVVKVFGSQTNATWGIDRVDQRSLPLNQTYTWDATGQGVRAYIIDTGIKTAHQEFGGRASFGFDAFGGNGEDGNGHGTHVAGSVGGATYGVAKNVLLIAVRVLDNNGSGTTTGVIAGMDWVAGNHIKPAVANMSLGGGASTATDDAVARMYDAGVPVIVAAGNGDRLGREQDACNYSPARAPKAYTVGATVNTDAKASYSNYGNCVNIFAPGSSITSAWYTSNTAINTISGTSMASPHVAGAAALYLETNTSASAQMVYDYITNNSTKSIVTSSKTTNNHLLYTLSGGTTPPPTNNPPTASFTFTTNELTASFNAGGSSDSDGSIVSYAWTFGDGTTGTGITPSKTYAAAGTYSVKLTVTDNEGATGSQTQSVSVSTTTPPPSGDNAPVINTFSVTKKTAGPWRVATIAWAVSDVDANLATVRLELLNGTTVLESANISVSGSTASGSNELKSRTTPTAVKIIVTDSKGNSATETMTY